MIFIEDGIKLVITIISAIDFLVFTGLFVTYLVVIQFKCGSIWTRCGAFFVMVFFLTFKVLHIPAFLSTIPLLKIQFPYAEYVLLGLTWSNILLAIVPLVAAFATFMGARLRKDGDVSVWQKKNVNIVMPIYNETPEALWKAIESVKSLEYSLDKVHLYLAFDDDTEPEAFKYIMQQWGKDIKDAGSIVEVHDKIDIFACRFAHGGKKSAQQRAYNLIKSSRNAEELEDSLLFFIDSDIQLKSDALWQFVRHMDIKKKNCLTGMITCVTSENSSFLSYYQDIEYVSGQIFWRNLEDKLGATSCLPGAFTILRWTSFDSIAGDYFSKKSYSDNFEYQRFYLGEDRYLTHLLMEKEPWKMGFCESARCKTEAPDTLMGLLKQRRRWFLGHISNDTWMISSLSLWKTYPILTLFNFLNNSRNTSIYIYLLYFILFLNKNVPVMLWFLYILLPILLNWVFIMYYSFRLRRKMNVVFYLMIVVCQPIFSMMFMYYTIYTIRTKSWGGVRVERNKEEETRNEMVEVVVEN